jgi:chromosome segregation ATPase
MLGLAVAIVLYVENYALGLEYETANKETAVAKPFKKYQPQIQEVKDDTGKKLLAKRVEKETLQKVLDEMRFALAQARQELARADEENQGLNEKVILAQNEVTNLLSDIRDQRDQTDKALEQQKELREEIAAPKNATPMRQLIVKAGEDQQAAEERQKALRQPLLEVRVQLSALEQRYKTLMEHLKELQDAEKAKGSGS